MSKNHQRLLGLLLALFAAVLPQLLSAQTLRGVVTRMVTGTSNPLYVSLMKQKAQLGVNEEGTEGSAMTLAEMQQTENIGQNKPVFTFYANRPFAYYLSEKASGAILFMGVFAGE